MDRRALAAASDRDALAALLTQIVRDLETRRTTVTIGRSWRLEEDSDGALVAVHGPTGRTVTLANEGA